MKAYLIDERDTLDGWTRVYWPDEAIELLRLLGFAHVELLYNNSCFTPVGAWKG